MAPMGKFHRVTAVLTTAVLALALAACTDDRPTAEDAARTLAEGLARLDVGQSAFTAAEASEVTGELATITEGFGPGAPQVTVAGVEETGEDSATATLDYVWDLDDSDSDWTYSTTADLTRVEDVWQAAWEPALFVPDLLPDEKLTLTSVPGDRGDITGAGGEVLVTERPVIRVGIDKTGGPGGAVDRFRPCTRHPARARPGGLRGTGHRRGRGSLRGGGRPARRRDADGHRRADRCHPGRTAAGRHPGTRPNPHLRPRTPGQRGRGDGGTRGAVRRRRPGG
ncbi:hypothetical protein MN0502_28580 [Arthrobacter sp. MN05-02]|nr:hypothetical protein MN0502_28580 [Arthrobacter sp. MN05-02]